MYDIKPQKYYTDLFEFLRSKENGKINFKYLVYYISIILVIMTIGQIIVCNSDPYQSEKRENERFITDEIKRQVIIDTVSLPITQTYFKSYKVIKLTNDLSYRINLVKENNSDKITKNAIIEKKANSKIVEIVNNNIRYTFEIEEITNYAERLFVFLGSLLFSFLGITAFIKKNKLEKEYEKNNP
ncbi:hypothetical protein [Flavobacterium sp. GCM10027622]|uniref:hypothetical protein n=1 Tax=unclassified Flavobacterium TaxID=196869 RepID=UPI00361D232E